VAGLENLRHQQASALAYFDCFWLFAVAILAVTFVVLFMKRSVAEKGARIGGEWTKYFVRPARRINRAVDASLHRRLLLSPCSNGGSRGVCGLQN
jgi:hypothetical protein